MTVLLPSPCHVIVDHRGVVVNGADAPRWHAVIPGPRRAEITHGNKGETAGRKPKPEAEAHPATMKGHPHPWSKARTRRQGRPTEESVTMPPGDPRRTPTRVRKPDPANPAPMPTPIVKGRPTPTVERTPIPAAIRENPSTAMHVGPPTRVNHRHRRPPAPPDVRQLHPFPIGRQRVVKESCVTVVPAAGAQPRAHRHRGRGRIHCRFRHRNRFTDRRHRRRGSFPVGHGQALIMADHRRNHFGREPQIVQIEDVVRPQVEPRGRILDERQ